MHATKADENLKDEGIRCIDKLFDRVDDLEYSVSILEKDNEAKDTEIENLKEKIRDLTNELEDTKSELDSANDDLAAKDSEIDDLKSDVIYWREKVKDN